VRPVALKEPDPAEHLDVANFQVSLGFHPNYFVLAALSSQLTASSSNVATDGAKIYIECVRYHIHSVTSLTHFRQPDRH